MRKVAFSWTGLLGIRFRGIDPDRFLTAVRNEFRWLFSPLALLPALAVMVYALSLVFGVANWHSDNTYRFICYLLIAALCSGLKVSLPSITGTMSVTSLFLLISLVQLSESETLVIGFIGTLIQCVWKPKFPIRSVRVAFSLAASRAPE